jgi:hypothetical protein
MYAFGCDFRRHRSDELLGGQGGRSGIPLVRGCSRNSVRYRRFDISSGHHLLQGHQRSHQMRNHNPNVAILRPKPDVHLPPPSGKCIVPDYPAPACRCRPTIYNERATVMVPRRSRGGNNIPPASISAPPAKTRRTIKRPKSWPSEETTGCNRTVRVASSHYQQAIVSS